ncbi:hypothetical protein GGI1_21374 [Acidithiobacillus sp. GGI-221]|nr:hypothetical protein GGI1_21374 [Acidithiobacillus sp. GGI-221]
MKKTSTPKPSKKDRAARVLPATDLTLALLEARLFLEQGVPPAPPGVLNATIVAGLLRDAVIRPALDSLAFLHLSQAHDLTVRNAPWIADNPEAPRKPRGYLPMFQSPAGFLVGCLLFHYLVLLTDQSTHAHRTYRAAAEGQRLVIDVDMAKPSIQIYLPEPVALAIGHAVASHHILGKSVA